MAPRLLRSPRGVVALVAVVVAVCAVGFTVAAQDWGATAVGTLGLVVAMIGLLPEELRTRLLALSGRRDVRTVLVGHATRHRVELARTVRPAPARAAVSVVGGSGAAAEHRELATEDAVRDLFDAAGGRMALIGEAGSGKTTTTILLFGALLSRAAEDPKIEVPFFARLSGWRASLTLEEWLVERLQVEVGLGRAEARAALPMIIPLLDGLDEVAEIDREACGREIAAYVLGGPSAPILVSCRLKEYLTSLLGGGAVLPTYTLQPLTVETLRAFFCAADPTRWEPLLAALTEPSGRVLAAALSSPLMASVVRDTVGNGGSPEDLVAATVGSDLDEAVARQRLWDRWLQRAEPALAPDDRAAAIGLAKAVEDSGSSEIRLERLGLPATRWIWFALKGVVAVVLCAGWPTGTLALPAPMVVAAFVPNLVDAAREVFARWPPRVARIVAPASFVASGVVALLAPSVAPPNALVSGVLAVACVVVAARAPTESMAPRRLGRLRTPPILTALLWAAIAAALVGVVVLLVVAVQRRFLPGYRVWPVLGVGLELALGAASGAGLDFVGQHVLARLWHRLVRGVDVVGLLRALERAGWVRRTSDSHRFLHLQLQHHLASSKSRHVRVSFDNAGLEALWADAAAMSARRDDQRAVDLWRRVVRARPWDGQAMALLADALQQLPSRPEREEALELVTQVCDRERGNADAWHVKARVLQALRRPREALCAVDEAVRLNGRWSGYRVTRAFVLRSLGELEEALDVAERACRQDPRSADPWYVRGEVLGDLGRWEEALEAADRAVEYDATMAAYQVSRAMILLNLNRVTEASVAAERAGLSNPRSADVWIVRSDVLAVAERRAEALRAADRAIELDGEWPGYRERRASLLLELGRWQEALDEAERLCRRDDENVTARQVRTEALGRLARWEKARTAAEEWCRLTPDDAVAWDAKAHVLWELDNLDDAVAAEDEAIARDEAQPRYHWNRAAILRELGRAEQALADVARVCELDPLDAEAWDRRAEILRDLHRPGEATTCAERARALVSGRAHDDAVDAAATGQASSSSRVS